MPQKIDAAQAHCYAAAMRRNRKSPQSQKETLVFIIIAALLMIAADQFIFGGTRPYIEQAKREYIEAQNTVIREEEPDAEVSSYDPFFDNLQNRIFEPDPEDRGYLYEEGIYEKDGPQEAAPASGPKSEDETQYIAPLQGPRPKIAVIIDDIGMSAKGSQRALDLPAAVTLAFLPYAPTTPSLAEQAAAAGHELMIHVPMEAMNATVSLGGMGLTSDMDETAFEMRLTEIFTSFDGYSGVNNHMGSKLTQDHGAMARVMARLKEKDLYFIDSKTIGSSVAAFEAAQAGINYNSRDVFLDHEDNPAFIEKALRKTERLALEKGYAIAIGHPKDSTMRALERWTREVQDRGFDLVPASMVLNRPENLQEELMASDLNEIVPAAGTPARPQ